MSRANAARIAAWQAQIAPLNGIGSTTPTIRDRERPIIPDLSPAEAARDAMTATMRSLGGEAVSSAGAVHFSRGTFRLDFIMGLSSGAPAMREDLLAFQAVVRAALAALEGAMTARHTIESAARLYIAAWEERRRLRHHGLCAYYCADEIIGGLVADTGTPECDWRNPEEADDVDLCDPCLLRRQRRGDILRLSRRIASLRQSLTRAVARSAALDALAAP